VRDAWHKNGTTRLARIFETLRRGFRIGHRLNRWPAEFKLLFGYCDANVHFEEIFRDESEVRHPVLGDVSWEQAAYTAESASRAVDLALDVLTTCVGSPVAGSEQLAEVPRRFGAIVARYDELRLALIAD
jgi:hypothetical protein